MRIAIWTGTITLGILGIAAVCASPLLTVRHLTIEGLAALTPDEAARVRATAALPPHTNIFRVPGRRLSDSLKRLPFVADASVSRRPPGTVIVTVEPRMPSAVLDTESGNWQIDAAGVAIRPATDPKSESLQPASHNLQLPEVSLSGAFDVRPGGVVDAAGVAPAMLVMRRIVALKPIQAAKIAVDQNGDMCLNMRDNVAIRLGQADDLDAKLKLIERIYQEKPDIGTEIELIDLRCPDAPACRPRGGVRDAGRSSDSAAGSAVLSGSVSAEFRAYSPKETRHRRRDSFAAEPVRNAVVGLRSSEGSSRSEASAALPFRSNSAGFAHAGRGRDEEAPPYADER